MLQKETWSIKSQGLKTFEQDEDVQIFLILLKYIFFSILVLPFGSNRRYFHVFPEDKLSKIYLNLQIQKVFTPGPNASCFLLEHQWMFEPNASLNDKNGGYVL